MTAGRGGGADRGQLERNLRLVRTGQARTAPGIRRCPDCRQPWIDDDSGLSFCRDCRVHRRRSCQDCGTAFPNTADGDRRCVCCRAQLPLFTPEPDEVAGEAGGAR